MKCNLKREREKKSSESDEEMISVRKKRLLLKIQKSTGANGTGDEDTKDEELITKVYDKKKLTLTINLLLAITLTLTSTLRKSL